jgi:hypothetical protein
VDALAFMPADRTGVASPEAASLGDAPIPYVMGVVKTARVPLGVSSANSRRRCCLITYDWRRTRRTFASGKMPGRFQDAVPCLLLSQAQGRHRRLGLPFLA